jgi:hypothetical protein
MEENINFNFVAKIRKIGKKYKQITIPYELPVEIGQSYIFSLKNGEKGKNEIKSE